MLTIPGAEPFSVPFAIIVSALCCSLTICMWFSLPAVYAHIPGPKPSSLLGYLIDIHNSSNLDLHLKIPNAYGHIARLRGGLFMRDALYVTDPLALRTIIIKEQDNFCESNEFVGLFGIIHHGDGVASVTGDEHRKQRRLMNPVFTASNVSKLTPAFYQIARELSAKIKEEIESSSTNRTIDLTDLLTRAALQFIGNCAIGKNFDSLDRSNHEFDVFREALANVLPLSSRLFLFLPFLNSWRKIRPVWIRRALATGLDYLPWSAPRRFRDTVSAMHPVFSSILEQHKAELDGTAQQAEIKDGLGNDLVNLLVKANELADANDRMAESTILANISSIVHGAQETSSGVLSRLISVMAQNRDLQRQLREELDSAKGLSVDGELGFKELDALPLLDAVIRETLRLYTPVTFVWRQTMQDTILPLAIPIFDPQTSEEHHEILVTKGTPVYLGLAAANISSTFWGPDANLFKPERWLKTNKVWTSTTVDNVKFPGIYSNTMSFLGGGRACPGMKFSILEMKVVLSVLLPSYSFDPAPGLEVYWRLGITLSPFVKGREEEGSQVPVRVTCLDS
ncbi:hypothetical protein HGRIS_013937 [Hohenbuehelia grisea]|uniref:Cytochrome P450 n=1 Tax=Hohenbuehelia grisea TaxID=104357 RepID=A0ABR3JSP1_9AGAR